MSRASECAGRDADPEFVEWLEDVDTIVEDRLQLSVFDLSDMLFHDHWVASDSPEVFVEEVVAENIREEYGPQYAALLRREG